MNDGERIPDSEFWARFSAQHLIATSLETSEKDQETHDVMDQNAYDRFLAFIGALVDVSTEDAAMFARWSAKNGGNSNGCDGCEISSDEEVFDLLDFPFTHQYEDAERTAIALTHCGLCSWTGEQP